MTVLSAAKAILEADATLLATATGGVWDINEAGKSGINRTSTPGAFDSQGVIKPCVLLKLRSGTPDGALADDATQTVSLLDILEAWFYQDQGYTAINTMRDRVYTLWQAKQLTGTFVCLWAGDVRGGRDIDLDASVERSDYNVRRKRN